MNTEYKLALTLALSLSFATAAGTPMAEAETPAENDSDPAQTLVAETLLVEQINEFRASPSCNGRDAMPAEALVSDDRLHQVQLDPELPLEDALTEAGYVATAVQVIGVSGPSNPDSAMSALQSRFCEELLDPEFSEIGVVQSDGDWRVLMASPLLSPGLGNWEEAGQAVMEQVNRVRAQPQVCGDQSFDGAPPLSWNAKLAATALAHSEDMAAHDFFEHEGHDGSTVAERAERFGYTWQRIGENLAAGLGEPADVVEGWLQSPPHCANLMNPDFTQMGAAYVVNPESASATYWTQVLGTPL